MSKKEIHKKIKKLKAAKAFNQKLNKVNKSLEKMPEKVSEIGDETQMLALEESLNQL